MAGKSRGKQISTADSTAAARPTTGRSSVWLFAVILIAAGSWTYANSFSGVFMADDMDAIVLNPHLRSLAPSQAFVAPSDTTLAGRPVASFTFALNYALAPAGAREVMAPSAPGNAGDPFYRNVWGYHAVNLVIHLLAGLALFGVVRRTLRSPPLHARFGAVSAHAALAVALIWLVHPLQTGSVTYVVQRVESLMGLWYLATLYCAIRAAESEFRGGAWSAAAVVACALGMGTKETMVSAPIFVALWLRLCRPDVRLLGPPRRLLAGLAATWVMLAWLVAGEARSQSVGFTLAGWTWWSYFRTQAGVIVHYVQLAFWPRPLVFYYGWMPAGSWIAVLPQILLLASLALATIAAIVRRHALGLLGAWGFMILAPSSSVLPIVSEVAAEHRMYLPLAAVVCLIVIGGLAVAHRFMPAEPTAARGPARWPVAAWIALGVVVVPLAWQTRARNRDYVDFGTMAESIVLARPENAVARLFLGESLFRKQRFAEAEAELQAAIALPLPPGAGDKPRALMQLYLGLSLCSHREPAPGATALERAVALDPSLLGAYAPLAQARLDLGQPRQALAVFDRALARFPDDTALLMRSAWVLATSRDATIRDGARAVARAERAARLTPAADMLGVMTLGAAYAEAGQFDRALETIQRAIEVESQTGDSPTLSRLRAYLAMFQARQPVRMVDW